MNIHVKFDWTEARVEMLKEIHALGQLSASLMAREIDPHGSLSHNAVIGKAHRLGLRRGGYSALERKPRKDKKPTSRSRKRSDWGPFQFGREAAPGTPSLYITPVPVEPNHISILHLTGDTCHWPYGESNFTFCGHETNGASYCPFHTKIAYRETKK